MIKISICIPTYNGERYFEECLKSVVSQKDESIEIIISDDCSNDRTIEIAKEFQKTDSRIVIYINESNLGLTGNWNKCLQLAKGEWIKFVFQDDILNEDCISKMIEHAREGINIIACNRDFIFEEDVDAKTRHAYLHEVLKLNRIFAINTPTFFTPKQICYLASHYLTSNFIGEPTSVLFRRNMIEEVGFFNNDLIQIGDFEYCLRIAIKYGLVFIPDVLTQFRVHKSATTHRNVSTKYNQAIYIDKIVITHELLYSKAYEIFRNNLTPIQKLKIKFYLRAKLDGAKRIEPNNDENTIFISEFKRICEVYDITNHTPKLNIIQRTILDVLLPLKNRLANRLKL